MLGGLLVPRQINTNANPLRSTWDLESCQLGQNARLRTWVASNTGRMWISNRCLHYFSFDFQTAICMPPCQNLGFCIAPGVCNCPDNFEGSECQFAKSKPCLDKPPTPMNSRVVCNEKECISTCNRGFTFPGGSKKLTMICDSGNWIQRQQQPGTFQKVPDCQRNYI